MSWADAEDLHDLRFGECCEFAWVTAKALGLEVIELRYAGIPWHGVVVLPDGTWVDAAGPTSMKGFVADYDIEDPQHVTAHRKPVSYFSDRLGCRMDGELERSAIRFVRSLIR